MVSLRRNFRPGAARACRRHPGNGGIRLSACPSPMRAGRLTPRSRFELLTRKAWSFRWSLGVPCKNLPIHHDGISGASRHGQRQPPQCLARFRPDAVEERKLVIESASGSLNGCLDARPLAEEFGEFPSWRGGGVRGAGSGREKLFHHFRDAVQRTDELDVNAHRTIG